MNNKPSIIFLHGWKGNINSWYKNINYFQELGFSTLALKMPGFDLPNPSADWGIPEYADYAYNQITEKFPGKKVILVGHSFGGRVSIFLASKYPELVEGLVLTNSAGLNLEPSYLRKTFILISNLFKWIEEKTFLTPVVQPVRKFIKSILGSENYKNADETMQEVFKNVVNLNLRDRLAWISCPTLIVWGEMDKTTPLKMARVIHVEIKNSQLEIIKEAAHRPHQTHSEIWNKIVGDFLTNLSSS